MAGERERERERERLLKPGQRFLALSLGIYIFSVPEFSSTERRRFFSFQGGTSSF